MYKCYICGACSKPRQSKLTVAIPRVKTEQVFTEGVVLSKQRLEIAREIGVCPRCYAEIESGTPIDDVVAKYRPAPKPPILVAVPAPEVVAEPIPMPAQATKPQGRASNVVSLKSMLNLGGYKVQKPSRSKPKC